MEERSDIDLMSLTLLEWQCLCYCSRWGYEIQWFLCSQNEKTRCEKSRDWASVSRYRVNVTFALLEWVCYVFTVTHNTVLISQKEDREGITQLGSQQSRDWARECCDIGLMLLSYLIGISVLLTLLLTPIWHSERVCSQNRKLKSEVLKVCN